MQIYISYSWKQPAMSIVRNWLCPILDQTYIAYCIDKEDCGYGQDIEKFEKEIGNADNVLIMLSNSYFYSINCMYEMALIIKNNGYKKRILWVSLDDFNRSTKEYDNICTYWENQLEQIRQNLRGDENRDRPFLKELEKVQLILNYTGKAWEKIGNINTLPFEELSANKFRKLIAYIKKEVLIDDETMNEIQSGIPFEPNELAPTINISQHGPNSVAQIINSCTSIINL